MSISNVSGTEELIRRLDEAVGSGDCECCQGIKCALEEICSNGAEFIEAKYLTPHPEKYARRLLHKDPAGRYSVVIMVWGPGQGTALHDHAGEWCVECVYRGRIRVVSYSMIGNDNDPKVNFEREAEIFAGVGEAGALIPPFEHHSIENPDETPAVTIHVYHGELQWCHVFLPVEGGYVQERRELCYTPF